MSRDESRLSQLGESSARRSQFGPVTVVASLFVATLAVNLQVPLYAAYADTAAHRQGAISLAFASYVAGLLLVLVLFGGVADRLGSKRALLLGLACAFAAHSVIIWEPTIRGLLRTRVLQGGSIALSLAAGTAYLVELGTNPRRAARLSSGAVTLGLGSGGPLTSAFLAQRRSLVPGSYFAVALATFACWCAVAFLQASRVDRKAPFIRIPHISKQTFPFGIALFLSWSLTGIILATVPAQLSLMGQGRWSGAIVFAAIAVGALVQLGAEVQEPRRFLLMGYVLGAAAMVLLIAGVHLHSAALLFIAAICSGFGSFGFTYLGGLTGTLLACRVERGRALSGYYLLGYLGFGLPCVAVGYVSEAWGLAYALGAYSLAVAIAVASWRAIRATFWRHAST